MSNTIKTPKVRKADSLAPLPEIVTQLREGETKQWEVQSGSTNRGDAYTDFGNHVFRTPFADEATARVIRAHELGHASISPHAEDFGKAMVENFGHLHPRVVECAEELRVNTFIDLKGFDISLLSDGSEKDTGKRVAKAVANGDENALREAFCFGTALIGTKAFSRYVSGVRSELPELANQLREMEKRVKKVYSKAKRQKATWSIGNRTDKRKDLPRGFHDYTLPVAEIVSQYFTVVKDDQRVEGGPEYRTGYEAGKFAPLHIDRNLPLTTPVKNRMAKRKRPATNGRKFAYPSRLLTDPEKRVFQQKVRASGGILVYDISGSMNLNPEDINKVLDYAPGALIIAYSHNRNQQSAPNAWIIADRGKRIGYDLQGVGRGVGNGCDGPALEWAIRHRRNNEPIIWVCDSRVTDATDHVFYPGGLICAELVMKHRILVAPTPDEAIRAIANPATYRSKIYDPVACFIPRSMGGNGEYVGQEDRFRARS